MIFEGVHTAQKLGAPKPPKLGESGGFLPQKNLKYRVSEMPIPTIFTELFYI